MIIAPSIFNANFFELGEDIKKVEIGGAEYLHVDITDGHFVPNISFGPNIPRDIRMHTDLVLDCHLMIENPEYSQVIPELIDASVDIITVHIESARHIYRALQLIKAAGIKTGIAINPGTPVIVIKELLHLVDQVLVMTCNPGVKNEKFILDSIERIKMLSTLRNMNEEFNFKIEVDGNITDKNIKACFDAGADIFVAGSFIYGHGNAAENIRKLKNACK